MDSKEHAERMPNESNLAHEAWRGAGTTGMTEEHELAAAIYASKASHNAQSARAALEQASVEAQLTSTGIHKERTGPSASPAERGVSRRARGAPAAVSVPAPAPAPVRVASGIIKRLHSSPAL